VDELDTVSETLADDLGGTTGKAFNSVGSLGLLDELGVGVRIRDINTVCQLPYPAV